MDKAPQNELQFQDRNQNYWQLASIQSASLGLPGIIVGGQIASQIGIGKAITSVIIGNLILWMIGLTIISMAAPERDNAIQITKRYLGKIGGVVATLFLILAFFGWYILQLNSASLVIHDLFHLENSQVRLGAGLGAFIALLSIGGIRLIKHFSVIVFPFLFLYVIYTSIKFIPNLHVSTIWDFSFAGIIGIMASTLAGIVNLPTFFRHSKSNSDSYLALSLMTIFIIIFQFYSIVAQYSDYSSISVSNNFDLILLTSFIVLSLMTVNLVNIYFSSAGWETIFPHRKSGTEYVIVGLLGTMAYTFLQISKPMEFLETMAENFIGSLGIILLLSFIVKIVVHHRPRPFERIVSVGCWLFGGIVGTVTQVETMNDSSYSLIIAICSASIAFLVVIFIEETIWSFKNAVLAKKEDQ